MRIVTVVGARPQFVKASPVSRAVSKRPKLEELLVHTGQHHDLAMSDAQFAALGLRQADVNLGIHGGSPTDALGRMLQALDAVLADTSPDVVLVYGDTTSTLAGALASSGRGIPVAHVEAGLRSFDRSMPEERNRVLTDRLSTLLFVPTSTGLRNLECEGITNGVELVGDVMLDAFLQTSIECEPARALLDRLGISGEYFVATLHRAETTSSAIELQSRVEYIVEVAQDRPVVLPLHPRTRAAAGRFDVDFGAIRLVDPVDYRVFGGLLAGCSLVLTDSGGVQKEAYFHRVPCVTLRSETEWPETVDAGWNRLWTSPTWTEPRTTIEDYGDGDASGRVVESIVRFLGLKQRT